MSTTWTLAIAFVVGWSSILMPGLIARVPEPPPEEPAEGEEESELGRILAEEGPKPLYADIATAPALGLWFLIIGMALSQGTAARLGIHPVTWVVVVLTPLLIALAYIDARTRLLPRILVLPATGALLVLALVDWAFTHDTHTLVREVVAMLVARSIFWILWFIRRAGMGFGDVRLAALVGLVLGRLSWNAWLVGLYAGLIGFCLFAVAMLLARRRWSILKKAYPYGPFMIGGMYVGVLTSGLITLV